MAPMTVSSAFSNVAGTSFVTSRIAQTIDVASANQQGQWLRSWSTVLPSSAITSAAASGAPGISHSTSCSVAGDMQLDRESVTR